MKVLVTGANGYIGQGVTKKLLDDGVNVIATDYSNSNIDQRAHIINANLFEIDEPYAFFDEPDVLLHLAWRNGFVHNDVSHINDLPLHYSFIRKMIEAGIKQVAIMGSMHEIGFYEGSIKADTPTNPLSLYGISKDALRRSIELLTNENHTIFQWMRGFYIVGNSGYGSSIFSKITAAENNGDKWFPFTSGQNQWDFIDYDLFCKEVAAVVEQTEYSGILNVCSGYPEKLADRVERFIHENKYKIKLKYGTFPDRKYDSVAVWGDSSAIHEIMEKKEKS